jgi:hypothetical protein
MTEITYFGFNFSEIRESFLKGIIGARVMCINYPSIEVSWLKKSPRPEIETVEKGITRTPSEIQSLKAKRERQEKENPLWSPQIIVLNEWDTLIRDDQGNLVKKETA